MALVVIWARITGRARPYDIECLIFGLTLVVVLYGFEAGAIRAAATRTFASRRTETATMSVNDFLLAEWMCEPKCY